MRFVAAVGMAVAMPILAGAEVVNLSINQTTTFGESVFVLSDLPQMGAGDVTRAVRMSPMSGVAPGYPTWSVAFDLPPNTTFTPTYYIRNDAPANLSNASNFTLIGSGAPVTTSSAPQSPQTVQIYAGAAVTSGTATITSPVNGATVTTISMAVATVPSGKLLSASIPAVHANQGRLVRFSLSDGTLLPPDGPVSIHLNPVWWRHGQAFLYDVDTMTSAPTAPRVETFTFSPANFQSRTIRVMLPRNYDSATSKTYPILYAEDGQNLIFPGGPFGYWDLNVAANQLTARGEMPEVIIVGIDNTTDRNVEYVPEYGNVSGPGRGGEYLAMIRDELAPEIATRYRELSGPENTAHIGSSLGGLLGFHAANEFESTFGAVLAMSPSFWVSLAENNNRALLPVSAFGRLYIDSGTAGASNDGYWDTANLRDRRLSVGDALGAHFTHAIGLGDQHNEAAWRNRAPNALRWLYKPGNTAASAVSEWSLY